MRTFRLALAQVNPTVGDIAGNTDIVLRRIEEARAQQADLVALPELMLTGYPPEDLLLKPSFIRDNIAALERVVAASKGIAVVVGFVNSEGNQVYNAAAVAHNGKLAGVYHKVYLPNYGVFDEDRYFKPGRVCPVYTINGVAVGVNICEDIWYALGPVPLQREAGAEVIVNINGSPFHAGKFVSRERMLGTRAADNGLYIGYVNTVGGQDELVFDGASVVLDVEGTPVARAAQFQEELLVADLDIERVFHHRLLAPLDRKETASTLEAIGRTEQVHVSDYQPPERDPLPERMAEPLDPVGEVYHALVLGTRDYVRKNGFSKVLVSLSGGIDSSITCVIAVDALGAENVEGISMPSRYSSDGSVTDSEEMAAALGVPLRIVPIESVHGAMEEALHPIFDGTEPNIAEQNVQARIRGNLLMAVSNKFGLAGAAHRQQERACHGLRDALRRHGRRLRCHQGRAQDPRLPAQRVAQPQRRARVAHSPERDRQAAQRRAEAGPARRRRPAALQPAGPDTGALRGAGPLLRRDGGHGLRCGDCAACHARGGP